MEPFIDTQTRPRRVQRVRHELKRRELEVLRVERLGASFVDITFTGESLADFVSDGFDDHVKFILEPVDGGEPVRRDYTPRQFDRAQRTLRIEFALHGEGAVSTWAAQARPGQRVTVGGPRGSMVVPMDHDWHLLAGDATALPAMRRRLEELPIAARVIIVAQLAQPADRQVLQAAVRPGADAELHWARTAEELVAQVRACPLPPGEGFVWAAGEAAAMASLRDVLLVEKGHPREAARVSAYWRRGSDGFHEELAD